MTKPEVDILNQFFLLIPTIEPENLPLEFENISISSRFIVKNRFSVVILNVYSDTNYPLYSGKPDISKIRFDFPLVPGDRRNFPLSGPFPHGGQMCLVTVSSRQKT